jgi:RNA polymerase sigma-70 factor (ECF subfamily)
VTVPLTVAAGGCIDVRVASDFDEFCLATQRRLLAQLYALTGDRGEAQDCLQEAYARAWQRWATISAYDDPVAWVRTVAWRIATSRWHRARNATVAWTRHGPPADLAPPGEDTVALVAALKKLPEAQRLAIVLHYLGGMPVEEIAHETRSPAGTVKARLARGRQTLAVLLDAAEPSERHHA